MRTAQPAPFVLRPRASWPHRSIAHTPKTHPTNPPGERLKADTWLPYAYGAVFLLGYLPGIWAGRSGQWTLGSQLADYYLAKNSYASIPTVWAWQFSAAFLQLAALLFCGFSALGCLIYPLLFLLRGGFLGLCAAYVLANGQTRGLVIYWLLSSLPNLSVLFCGLWLSGHGARLSLGLWHCMSGSGTPRGQLPASARRLAVRFAVCLLVAGLATLAGSWLSVVLAGVLL